MLGRSHRFCLKLASCALLVAASAAADGHDERRPFFSETDGINADMAGFSGAELARLHAGKSVKRRFLIGRGEEAYHAGYSYRLVHATPMQVIRALRQPDGIKKAIPYGLSATTISENNGVSRMRIAQGKRPIVGSYTVRMEWDLRDYRAKFWMDPTEDHDVNDLWGVFSAREVSPGVTLVSFGFAFDIGGVGSVLERKAQTWGLTTSDRIASLVSESL